MHALRLLADAGALPHARRELMRKATKVQETLGDWHDLHVLSLDADTWNGIGTSADRLRRNVGTSMVRKETQVLAHLNKLLMQKASAKR